MEQSEPKMFYRVSRAAEVLDISRSQMYKLIADGFPAVKIGKSIRVPARELNEWAAKKVAEGLGG